MAVALIQVHKPNSCIGLQQSVPICQALDDFCGLRSQTGDRHCGLRAATTVRDGKHFIAFNNYFSQHPPFSYNGEYKDNLVSISTGVVAPNYAHVDCAVELGNNAVRLVNDSFADVQLK